MKENEFKGSIAFLSIPIGISRDPVLLDKYPKAIILMGEIVSMLNVTGKFYMSNKALAQRLRCTRKTVINYLNLLEERGFIKRQLVKDETGAVKGRLILPGDNLVKAASLGWGNPLHGGGVTEFTGVVNPVTPKKNNIKEQKNRTDKDIGQVEPDNPSKSKSSEEKEEIPYKEIIDYLNKKTGRRFPASAKRNREPIHARWRDGFRLKDFKRVIDNKCFSWGNSLKMSPFLRPTTLFGPKFVDYLNENNIPANATVYDFKDFENQKLPQDDDDLPF